MRYLTPAVLFTFCALFSCNESTSHHDSADEVVDTESKQIIFSRSHSMAKGDLIDFNAESKNLSFSKKDGAASIETEIHVTTTGRYKLTIEGDAVDTSTIWIEDYIDNQDDRSYNVTGNVLLTSGQKQTIKWGSPLSKGTHKMRIHLDEAPVNISNVQFDLIRAHQATADTLIQRTSGSTWSEVWADEFDKDGLPDSAKWTYDVGDWGWGNNEMQYYEVERLENSRIEKGHLIIEAHKNDNNRAWSSARLTTRGKVSFKYGRIDIRAKVPAERGNWAAAWTLGDAYVDELSWPYCGEIDILETVGFEVDDKSGKGIAHATIHCPAYYFKLGNQPTGVLDVDDIVNTFHIYSVEWTDKGIKAFVDDEMYFEYHDTSNAKTWPFDQPQNIILNLAMGGGWGGAKGMDDSVTSQQYVVDYVRVSELVK